MEINLRLHCRLAAKLRQLLPTVRITQVRTLAALVVALQSCRGIHLGQIASVWPGSKAQLPSLVNRLHRFVCNPLVVPVHLYRPFVVLLLARAQGAELRLVADVTRVGLACRMLTLSLACRRRTLPLAWSVHAGVKGAVNVSAQIALLEEIHALLPPGSRVLLLADAGFEATELVRWLLAHHWRFTLRRPGCHMVQSAALGLGWRRLESLPLLPGQTHFLAAVRWTQKAKLGPLSLTLHWGKKEKQPWYLLSTESDPRTAVRHYQRRMWVEEMYGDFKKHGFNLEVTHLRCPDRIERLVLALCISYLWFVALATWLVKNKRRRLLDPKSRRDKSYFRLGLDWTAYCRRLDIPIDLRFVPYF